MTQLIDAPQNQKPHSLSNSLYADDLRQLRMILFPFLIEGGLERSKKRDSGFLPMISLNSPAVHFLFAFSLESSLIFALKNFNWNLRNAFSGTSELHFLFATSSLFTNLIQS